MYYISNTNRINFCYIWHYCTLIYFWTPWISVGWQSVGDFFDIRSADTMSDFVSAEILSVIFWIKICRRSVIFSDLMSVFKNDTMLVMMRKKWHNVGQALFHFFLNLCRLFKMTKWHKVGWHCVFFYNKFSFWKIDYLS
jgi:hypothetical protein